MSTGYMRVNPTESAAEFLARVLAEKERQLECAKAGTVVVRNLAITDDLVLVSPGGENYEAGRAKYEAELEDQIATLRRALAKEHAKHAE